MEMAHAGKFSVLGVLIDSIDYDTATNAIFRAACERRGLSVSALAVHGVMTGVLDRQHKFRLNHLDIVVPDGQPVRWALNLLYRAGLRDRVYGPNLMLKVCERAAKEDVPVYLFGSTSEVLQCLKDNLTKRFPRLRVAGMQPSRFRRLTIEEKESIARQVQDSEAKLVFVGMGCPRQEVWAYEFRDALGLPIIAVGAAFAFHAGLVPQAPYWMQQAGLEWLFRWWAEPRRLWSRYLLLNPLYLLLLILQMTRFVRFDSKGCEPVAELLHG
jgi:N-acetylglucosaminyldiphosphoundecaprenol N-acetyl-beta-D-mannosaminyltransferase